MAKINVLGDAVVITSSLTIDEIKMVQKFAPKALSLYSEENGHEVQTFSIGVCDGPGTVTPYGICFGRASRDGGFAQLTTKMPAGDGDPKELIADAMGAAVMGLQQLEALLPDVIADLSGQQRELYDCIELG